MPKVYSKRRPNEIPKGAVYVGRPTIWGNRWRAGVDGSRSEVVAKFRHFATRHLKAFPNWLKPLKGKDLVCWCAPLECHADVLLELANKE